MHRLYPWQSLIKTGSKGVSTTAYGQQLMRDMMMVYDGDKDRYVKLVGAVEKNLDYAIKATYLIICGKEDRAGSCARYLKAYEEHTGKSVNWIEDAGHNANTDQPEMINALIDEFITTGRHL